MSPGKMGTILIIIIMIISSIVLLRDSLPTTGNDHEAYVDYVSDGDTFKITSGDRVRLLGINTEELGMPHAEEAKNKLIELLGDDMVRLEADVENTDRYDRLLRYVWVGDILVNLEMVRQGYAHVYVLEPNTRYWSEFKEAEAEAIAARTGIWESSAFDVEVADIKPVQGTGANGLNLERVTFRNNGTETVNITNWVVKDEAAHIYQFGNIYLSPGQSITLSTGSGTDTNSTVYWGSDTSIWNNDGDVIFLRDRKGHLVDGWRYWENEGEYVYQIY